MKFMLVDKIEKLQAGKEITVSKNLSLAEEYLADHFPSFPVLPGVLILQVAIEAGSWLVRVTNDFSQSVITLKEASQIRYGNFVAPGQRLTVTVKVKEMGPDSSRFQARGVCGGLRTLQGNFELNHFNLAAKGKGSAETDEFILARLREQYRLIGTGVDTDIQTD